MDRPSLDSPRPPFLSDRQSEAGDACQAARGTGQATREDTVLIAGFGNAVAVDFAAFIGQSSHSDVVVVAGEEIRRLVEAPVRFLSMNECLRSTAEIGSEYGQVDSLILFINSRLSRRERFELDEIVRVARQWQTRFVGIVGTFRVHLDDPDVAEVESYVLSRARTLLARVVVFRPGHVLSRHSGMGRLLRRFAPLYPLVPRRQCSCFVEGTELFGAIEAERRAETRRGLRDDSWPGAKRTASPKAAGRAVGGENRAYTLLGSNRPWHDMLAAHREASPRRSPATAISMLLSWLMLGHLMSLVLNLSARRFPWMRQWNVHTLRPRSIRELLSLCHQRNLGYVKVVGYNNGVVHFGHRYAGKTIVSTIHCCRMVRANPNALKVDCGATVRDALDFLATSHQELYVVPNYSYVSLGTAFFVPIHGSAVDYSTVADTICRVVFYDPESDRIISAARDDTAFIEHVYDQRSRVVVLRLYVLAKPRSSYFVRHETLKNPAASDILGALRDRGATNVEIRQAHAASAKVTVSRYFKEPGETSAPALELPRDALGRLWDRLEENLLTSYLMHAVGRHVVWHAELFFEEREFILFWRTHDQLPLRKLQLRYIRRDEMTHSPFRDEDCVSIDLFMFRRHRFRFQEYLKNTFSKVRTNPGKHSN
jgi:hypothetical protein